MYLSNFNHLTLPFPIQIIHEPCKPSNNPNPICNLLQIIIIILDQIQYMIHKNGICYLQNSVNIYYIILYYIIYPCQTY